MFYQLNSLGESGISMIFRFLTSGESHGKCLNTIIDGVPAGIDIDIDFINGKKSLKVTRPRDNAEKGAIDNLEDHLRTTASRLETQVEKIRAQQKTDDKK